MDYTVVGMFDTAAQAQQAARQLTTAGFGLEHVDVSNAKDYDSSNDAADNSASSTAAHGAAGAVGRTAHRAEEGISGFFSNLFGSSNDEDNDDAAQRYHHVARSTGSIVTVHCQSSESAHQAAGILDEAGALDVDERAAQTGYQSSASRMADNSRTTNSNASTAQQDKLTAEVIEENLQVGKRTEQTGGVRLRSRIVERPVEASVRLREEHVVVNRIPINRPATEADFQAFKEGQVEITESAERAVVAKEAHVVEEVSLGKQVTEREEIIRDTVRNTEVDIEQIPGASNTTDTSYDQTRRSNS